MCLYHFPQMISIGRFKYYRHHAWVLHLSGVKGYPLMTFPFLLCGHQGVFQLQWYSEFSPRLEKEANNNNK